VKWYKKISQNGISVEAKFEYQKKKFSIEFDTTGVLKDVEFIINKVAIAPLVYQQIEHELDSLFQKWRFQKIQMQDIGRNDDTLTFINSNEAKLSLRISYEIVLKGKTVENAQLYEIAFNDDIEIQQVHQIEQK
jgi:hypothetical protein